MAYQGGPPYHASHYGNTGFGQAYGSGYRAPGAYPWGALEEQRPAVKEEAGQVRQYNYDQKGFEDYNEGYGYGMGQEQNGALWYGNGHYFGGQGQGSAGPNMGSWPVGNAGGRGGVLDQGRGKGVEFNVGKGGGSNQGRGYGRGRGVSRGFDRRGGWVGRGGGNLPRGPVRDRKEGIATSDSGGAADNGNNQDRGGAGVDDKSWGNMDTAIMTDKGVGSMGDLIQSAKIHKIISDHNAGVDVNQNDSLEELLEKWQSFAKSFTDCRNAISNIECSLKASKLNYECKFLSKCSLYSIFTGVLHINRLTDNRQVAETVFVARGLGLNKKSAKLDCYDKAYTQLMNSSARELMAQEDCGEKFLIQQVTILYNQDSKGFKELLKKCNSVAEIESGAASRFSQGREAGVHGTSGKRSSSSRGGGSGTKKAKFPDYLSEMLENKSLSLAPQKKVGILMNPEDPIIDKLNKLKKLLKEEGITKLHLVPKIDQIAHKTAIHIQNVYRFVDIPILGYESRMPVFCEIYFDDVFMASGQPDFKRNVTMQDAYANLAHILYSEPLEVIVSNSRIWHPVMARDPEVCNVVVKWQGEDNNSLLTSNLANMKQMMQSMPNVKIPIEKMVLTEHEADKDIENVFKALELSATRNLMLLECEIVRNPDMSFTCMLSLQGRTLTSRTHTTKNGAKRLCSEAVMKEMRKTHDSIYVAQTNFIGKTITKEELIQLAYQKKGTGEPPGKIFYKKSENKLDSSTITPELKKKMDEDRKMHEEIENLPENVQLRPLLPWIAAAMYDIIDEYYKKITLEDLMLDVKNMAKSQREVVTACATKMGLRVVTKLRNSHDASLLRRTVTAQDMCKILQLNGGESGRYKLTSCKHQLSQAELNKFKDEYLNMHRKLVESREQDDPNAEQTPEAGTSESPGTASPSLAIKTEPASPTREAAPQAPSARLPLPLPPRPLMGLPPPDYLIAYPRPPYYKPSMVRY